MAANPSSHYITYEQVQTAAQMVRERFGYKPNKSVAKIGVILGSGLGGFAGSLAEYGKVRSIPYADIPHFPVSHVEGHASNLHLAKIDETPILLMQGRVHRYEGYSASQVAFPMRVMMALGVETVILTNAAAGLDKHFEVGDLMLITDHINFTGDCPLLGPNDLRFGPRFLDMTEAYSKSLIKIAKECAKSLKFSFQEGVYGGVLGPNYETPAEIKMFQKLGVSAVGMSTVYETFAARHGGAKVLGISCITNKGAGMSKQVISHEEVQENAALASVRFTAVLTAILRRL